MVENKCVKNDEKEEEVNFCPITKDKCRGVVCMWNMYGNDCAIFDISLTLDNIYDEIQKIRENEV